jgi:hypothetical protein
MLVYQRVIPIHPHPYPMSRALWQVSSSAGGIKVESTWSIKDDISILTSARAPRTTHPLVDWKILATFR